MGRDSADMHLANKQKRGCKLNFCTDINM